MGENRRGSKWNRFIIKDPSFIYFSKKSLKNWVKIEKNGYFQKLLFIALQKFQALRQFQTSLLLGLYIFPDPTVICNTTFIREIKVS